jgi:hypothetical protein
MSGIHEFDDQSIDALLTGHGAEVNGDLAGIVADIRATFISQPPAVGPELAALIGDTWPAAATASERRARGFALRRLVVAVAVVFGLTSGLAVANALPGPVQDAMAKVGIGEPSNHGKAVSEIARDKSLHGCEHGRAVSAAAWGKTKDKPCRTTSTTTAGETTTTTTTTVESESANGAGVAATPGENANLGNSDVARDKSVTGCEHGRAVSGAVTDKTPDRPCPTTTTTTTSTTIAGNPGDDNEAPGNSGNAPGKNKEKNATRPTDSGLDNGTGRQNTTDDNSDD